MLPILQDVVGVWESRALPGADAAESALWDRRKLRVRKDGTFTIYGFKASGRWRVEGNRLILKLSQIFGQEKGTPLHRMMGGSISIAIKDGSLGNTNWSFRPEVYPTRWKRVPAPKVITLLTKIGGEDTSQDFDYFYDELQEGGPATANELAYLLSGSPSFDVAFWAQTFMARHPNERGLVELLASLKSPNFRIARNAANRLRDLPDPLALGPLLDFMAAHPKARTSALGAISKIPSDEIVPILRRELTGEPSEYGATYSLEGLAARKDFASRPVFLRYSADRRDGVSVAALSALARTGGLSPAQVARAEKIARSGSWLARADAVEVLGEIRRGRATLIFLLDDGEWIVRREAVKGLARFGPIRAPSVRRKMQKLLWDENFQVRNAAGHALSPK